MQTRVWYSICNISDLSCNYNILYWQYEHDLRNLGIRKVILKKTKLYYDVIRNKII